MVAVMKWEMVNGRTVNHIVNELKKMLSTTDDILSYQTHSFPLINNNSFTGIDVGQKLN